jgi:DUF4097 and DUF4098 domain-containing protein YvlB
MTAMKRLGTLLLLAATPLAWAGERVEQRRSAAPDGLVEIENPAGSIHVVGWDKNEVEVVGTLGRGAEGVDVSGGAGRIAIEVETLGHPRGTSSDLEIRVPKRSRLEIDGFAASIKVEGIDGLIQAETVNGEIVIAAGSKEVSAESVNGAVDVSCPCQRVEASSVNGAVTVRGASGTVDASTVNGRLIVEGGSFDRVQLETVNGQVRFAGDLASGSTLDVETVGGAVELVFPASVSADFTVSTFSGSIANEFGQEPRRTSRYTSEKELAFTTAKGGATVTVNTLSGGIRLAKQTK